MERSLYWYLRSLRILTNTAESSIIHYLEPGGRGAEGREKQIPEKNEVKERSYSSPFKKRVSKKAIRKRKHHKPPITIVKKFSIPSSKNVKLQKFALDASIFLDCLFIEISKKSE